MSYDIRSPDRRSSRDAQLIAGYTNRKLPLATASLPDEYFYQSLPLCVIDAVWSIGVRYAGVRRVVDRYCEHSGLPRLRVVSRLLWKFEGRPSGVRVDGPP